MASLAHSVRTAARNLALGLDEAVPLPPEPGPSLTYAARADIPVEIGCVGVFRAEHLPDSQARPWLDQPDALDVIARRLADRAITPRQAEICRFWHEHGYYVARGAIDADTIDGTWAAYEAALARGDVVLSPDKAAEDDPHPRRCLNPHLLVDRIDQLLRHPALVNLCSLVMGREAIPFQTIASHKGSQQAEHSDSIRMTTCPLGYLAACWVAMEDIHAESGPLVYYPGSHRWPYVFSQHVGITPSEFRERSYAAYTERYEPAIRQSLAERGAAPHTFLARKGDVLFWHANLLHGGAPRASMRPSRKALVHHYFAKDCICYHDLAASASAVHGPVEAFPTCGASNPVITRREKIA